MKKDEEASYILREYFKGFLPEQVEIMKIKNKINKINRENILATVVEHNKDIYHIVAENYKNTYELIDQFVETINKLKYIC